MYLLLLFSLEIGFANLKSSHLIYLIRLFDVMIAAFFIYLCESLCVKIVNTFGKPEWRLDP